MAARYSVWGSANFPPPRRIFQLGAVIRLANGSRNNPDRGSQRMPVIRPLKPKTRPSKPGWVIHSRLEMQSMKKLLGALGILIAALTLSALAQGPGRLSPDDQREFDKYYTKWVNDTRKNDRDDIAKDVKHMQEIMGRNGIPSSVPYEQIATTGSAYPTRSYQGRLSAHDQS